MTTASHRAGTGVRLEVTTPAPAAKYRALATHLGDAFRVYIGYHQGHPVVGDIGLLDGNAHNTRGAMGKDRADAVRGAGLLVQTHAIRDACAAGAAAYNMGETGTSSSHAAFTEHLGRCRTTTTTTASSACR